MRFVSVNNTAYGWSVSDNTVIYSQSASDQPQKNVNLNENLAPISFTLYQVNNCTTPVPTGIENLTFIVSYAVYIQSATNSEFLTQLLTLGSCSTTWFVNFVTNQQVMISTTTSSGKTLYVVPPTGGGYTLTLSAPPLPNNIPSTDWSWYANSTGYQNSPNWGTTFTNSSLF